MFRFAHRLALIAFFAASARAVELRLEFGAIERMLAEQVFTEDGRRYVHGSAAAKCNFAYLEKPHIEADSGRLRIHARFTGRSALNLFGQCVGLGDAFNLVITTRPEYKDGNLRLADVKVASDGKTGYYIRRVCSIMSGSLAHDFKYPIESEARRMLEDPATRPGYKREVQSFSMPSVTVAADALVLQIDFRLTVR